MTEPKVISPLLLAEELTVADIWAVFAERESEPASAEYRIQEPERNFWRGGLMLDLALHPDTKAEADDYFEDAELYWQRVLDSPSTHPERFGIYASVRSLITHLPAFKVRKAKQADENSPDLSLAAWDKLDLESAIILEEVLADPAVRQSDKDRHATRIGTQLLCGTVSIQTYPSTARETLQAARGARHEHRGLSHGLYAIRNDRKVPLQARMKEVFRQKAAWAIRVPFGCLAQEALRAFAPATAALYPERAQCVKLVSGWLIELAKNDDIPAHAAEAVDYMADKVASLMDNYDTSQ